MLRKNFLNIADNMYGRSEPDYLICNAPLEYTDLILNGDPEKYLKAVTEHKPLGSELPVTCGEKRFHG